MDGTERKSRIARHQEDVKKVQNILAQHQISFGEAIAFSVQYLMMLATLGSVKGDTQLRELFVTVLEIDTDSEVYTDKLLEM